MLDEDVLILQASRGDVKAYEQLVCRYQDLAFRTACLVTGEAAAAEDACQEAFLRAYRAIPRFRRGSPFRPWLLRIVVNEAKRRKSSLERHTRLELYLKADRGARSWTTSAEREVLSSEERANLHAAIKRLPESDQLVIAYRFALGLSEAEMSEAMECPKGTVKSRLSRALRRLREDLTMGERELLQARVANE